MNFLKKLDSVIERIIKVLLGVSTFGVMIMVFAQVIFRYFLPWSIGGFEELPLYLMLAEIWLGAILLCRDGTHTSVDILLVALRKKPKATLVLNVIADILTIIALGFAVYLIGEYMVSLMVANTISAGLGFPMWWISFMITACAALMAIYTFVHMLQRFSKTDKKEGEVS